MSAMDVVYARKRPAAAQGARQVTPMRAQPRRDAPLVGLYQARYAQQLNRRGQTRRESSYLDTASASYLFSTTGSIKLLNPVPQGASVVTRVGKKIEMTSLQLRGVYANKASPIADAALIIVYDKRPTGALPAITDVLNTVTSASFNKDDNSGRFKILKRDNKVFVGANATGERTAKTAYTADFFLNLRGLPVTYKSAGTGAIGDIEEGALYAITCGSIPETAAPDTDAPQAVVGYRLRFKDV